MTGRVGLCNEALGLLGDKSIVDLNGQTPQARACAVSYGPALAGGVGGASVGLCDAAGTLACLHGCGLESGRGARLAGGGSLCGGIRTQASRDEGGGFSGLCGESGGGVCA